MIRDKKRKKENKLPSCNAIIIHNPPTLEESKMQEKGKNISY